MKIFVWIVFVIWIVYKVVSKSQKQEKKRPRPVLSQPESVDMTMQQQHTREVSSDVDTYNNYTESYATPPEDMETAPIDAIPAAVSADIPASEEFFDDKWNQTPENFSDFGQETSPQTSPIEDKNDQKMDSNSQNQPIDLRQAIIFSEILKRPNF